MDFNQFVEKVIYFFQAIFSKKDNFCPYCLSKERKIVFKKKFVIDICYCLTCYLYWTNPIFKFRGYYNFLYKAQGLTTKLDKKALSLLLATSFKSSDKDFYEIIKWLRNIAPGKKLLEFGSSWGYFLYQAQLQNFEAIGIEISKKRAEFSKKYLGVNSITDINTLLIKKEKFNIIFSAHSLEHLGYRIRDIFDKFYNLLTEDGIIVMEVPHLNLEKGKEAFKIMGAIHPLGFSRDFFIKNMPRYNLEVEVYNGYRDLIIDYKLRENNNLVVICKRR